MSNPCALLTGLCGPSLAVTATSREVSLAKPSRSLDIVIGGGVTELDLIIGSAGRLGMTGIYALTVRVSLS